MNLFYALLILAGLFWLFGIMFPESKTIAPAARKVGLWAMLGAMLLYGFQFGVAMFRGK